MPGQADLPMMGGSFNPGAFAGPAAYTPVLMPFKFRERREAVDWRRLGAVDVERVAREVDVATSQEYITTVTYCDVTSERCARCQAPADPLLVKLLRLAQLTVEYLVHTQGCLGAGAHAAHTRTQGLAAELGRARAEAERLAEELKAARDECRRRKKLVAALQLMLQANANHYHKCQFCDKAFMNYAYLQNHVERRHQEVTEGERQKKRRVEKLEEELEGLRDALKHTQGDLQNERQAQALLSQKEQEAHRERERDVREWQERERKAVHGEVQRTREDLQREISVLSEQNVALEMRVQEMGKSRTEDDMEKQNNSLMALKEQLRKQDMKMQSLQNKHEQEKSQMQRDLDSLHDSLSNDQKAMSTRLSELRRLVKERDALIREQKRQIQGLSSTRVEKPQIESEEEEEEEEEEEAEEEEELESSGERRPPGPGLLRELRASLQNALDEKLEGMGVRQGARGISQQVLLSSLSVLRTQRSQATRRHARLPTIRRRLKRQLEQRVQQAQQAEAGTGGAAATVTTAPRGGQSGGARGGGSAGGPGSRGPTSGGAARKPVNGVGPKQTKGPSGKAAVKSEGNPRRGSPGPQTKVIYSRPAAANVAAKPRSPGKQAAGKPGAKADSGKTSNARTPAGNVSTPPFTSDDDSDISTSPPAIRKHDGPATRTAEREPSTNGRIARQLAEEWSDGSELESITIPGQKKPQSTAHPSPQGEKVQILSQKIERQLSKPGSKKPPGGVHVITSTPSHNPSKASSAAGQKRVNEADDEEDNWDISSLEDVPVGGRATARSGPVPAPRKGASSPGQPHSTAVPITSTSKAGETLTGLKEQGSGSTLKSSLVTVTDWTNDDFSDLELS
ncbi:cilium assembly protein DZIP1L-like isoform X3 [Lethenteron reissneri]|uniref:cilium assembly protein DZIP1L-like isoform X3 n=1 Tax=Lethenteron reissneri TaxID=7753 RepID=UPI002AB7C135|nr:cilium assembly protein DZIP1L-like isoform X3 [Lethenteron reissneri]